MIHLCGTAFIYDSVLSRHQFPLFYMYTNFSFQKVNENQRTSVRLFSRSHLIFKKLDISSVPQLQRYETQAPLYSKSKTDTVLFHF